LNIAENNILNNITGMNDTNVLDYLKGMNASLAADIQNLLSSITDDVIAMNSSLSDDLTTLLNTMTTNDDALRTWLEFVLAEIDSNLTKANDTLQSKITGLDASMTNFYNNLDTDLGDIISDLQDHDIETGKNHTDIIDMLSTLQTGVGDIDLDELKTILSNLAGNLSAQNESIASALDEVVGDIGTFETQTTQRLTDISNILDDLATWEDILAELTALDGAITQGNQQLQSSIDEVPTEKAEEEAAFGIAGILLLVVIVLLIINLLLMLMKGKKEEPGGIVAVSQEKVEPKSVGKEREEEWEGAEEEPEEEEEDIEEIYECPECGAHVGATDETCPSCGEELLVEEEE
jgi:hypothetical protein